MRPSQENVKELERNLASGDVAAASRTLVRIYDEWALLDEATQKDMKALEALYLSMVQRITQRGQNE